MTRTIVRWPIDNDHPGTERALLIFKDSGVAIRVEMNRAVLEDGYEIVNGHLGIHCSEPDIYYPDEDPSPCPVYEHCYGGGGHFRGGTEVAEHWYRGEESWAWSIVEDWHRRHLP